MRSAFPLALGILLFSAASAGAEVAVAPIEGDGDPALLAELQRPLEAGADSAPYKPALSWVFTTGTVALYALAVARTVEHARSEPGPEADFGEEIGWTLGNLGIAVLYLISLELEAFNAGLVRPLWYRSLRRAERAPGATVAAVPFVVPGSGRSERSTAGLSAVILF